jgi:hypothetical protein
MLILWAARAQTERSQFSQRRLGNVPSAPVFGSRLSPNFVLAVGPFDNQAAPGDVFTLGG